ncbi:MAG: hypothetical protein Q9188_003122, partial [Gyalolechia gomerana]
MAKEKPSTESEEKRLKREKKEKKRSETEGVHKSSSKKKDKPEKKDKKDKKDRKPKTGDEPPTDTSEAHATAAEDVQMTTELLNSLEKEKPGSVVVKEDGGVEVKVKNVEKPLLIGALVPFAHPLADEKVGKKVLKGVRRGNVLHIQARKKKKDISLYCFYPMSPWVQLNPLFILISPPRSPFMPAQTLTRCPLSTAAKNKTLKRGVKEVVKSLRKSPPPTSSLPSAIVILAADISPMDVISHLPVLCEDHGIP